MPDLSELTAIRRVAIAQTIRKLTDAQLLALARAVDTVVTQTRTAIDNNGNVVLVGPALGEFYWVCCGIAEGDPATLDELRP